MLEASSGQTVVSVPTNLEGAAAEVFLSTRQVRARYGNSSDMWIWRRLHDDSGFPQPMIINKRRFWQLSDLLEWERSQSRAAA